jgi:hypothetical protein
MATEIIDRRRFLGSMSFAVGGVAVGSWLPAALQAAPAACLANAAALPDACGDWQLDDICIAYPPYSLHMKSSVCHATASQEFEPVDSHWIA